MRECVSVRAHTRKKRETEEEEEKRSGSRERGWKERGIGLDLVLRPRRWERGGEELEREGEEGRRERGA